MSAEWICPECGRADADPLVAGAVCPHDGRVLIGLERLQAAATDPVLGRVVGGQYAVYDRLGRGGMGAVYRAVHQRLGRHVALKTILPDRVDEDCEELRARFELEARVLSDLRHPGIVTVYDFGEEQGVLYMVLELIEGQTLAAVLRGSPRLPASRALDIATQLASALREPHRRGLVHRDIKPSNILLEPRADGSERVVLIDFGIAKAQSEFGEDDPSLPKTRTGVAVGTPRYMAPEQLAGGEIGPWTDHYAVAVLLYRMLAGESPYTGPPAEMIAAHLRDPVPPLPAELGLAAFDPVIARAMAKRAGDRFRDGAQLVGALEAAASMMPGAAALDPELGSQPTAAMQAARTAAVAIERVALGAEPTPSDFSSAWRGALDMRPPPDPVGPRWGLRWFVAAALVGVVMSVALLWFTSLDGAERQATTRAAVDSVEAPVAEAPAAAIAPEPDAAPPEPDAAPPEPDAAPPEPDAAPDAAPAPVAQPSKPRPARPVRAAPTAASLGRLARRHLDACRCGEARAAIDRLARLDASAARALDGDHTMQCGLVGMGCLSGGAGGR